MMEEVELDPTLRGEIDRLHARLDELDHYTLLGVARSADRKVVKSAYYAHASKIHPDRHFGRKLGPYKLKMEQLFGRMTVAHDTLTAAQRRAEYDAYLAERDQLLAFEKALDIDELAPVAEERPVDASRVAGSAPRVPATTAPATPAAPSPEAERARREALARRLLGGSSKRMPATSTSTPSMKPVTPSQQSAPPGATPTGSRVGVETLINTARAAAGTGDLVSASMRMRLAAKIDARYSAEAEELTRRAHAAMADAYVKQAHFEETEERWVAAALSWTKAHEGRPHDPEIAERAANSLRLARGDLHRAVRLAETAARLRPHEARYRLTLVETYLDAGLMKRARAELDNAMRMAPTDPRGKSLHDELRRRGA